LADRLVMGVARLELLREGVDVAGAALEDATAAQVGADAQKQTYLRLEAQGWMIASPSLRPTAAASYPSARSRRCGEASRLTKPWALLSALLA
jgi:hypothetical protein